MKCKLNGQGIITLPGSKSIAIRALIIASFLDTTLKLQNFPWCEDTLTLVRALQDLGFGIERNGNDLILNPAGEYNLHPKIEIKDSAAALRFLLFRLAGWPEMQARVKISPQLTLRPLDPLVDIIRGIGGRIEKDGNGFNIRGTESLSLFYKNNTGIFRDAMSRVIHQVPFKKSVHTVLKKTAPISSQFLSGILLSTPLFREGISLELETGQVSSSYIDLTLKVMKSFGMKVKQEDKRITIPEQNYHNPGKYWIEEDFSSACYFWAIGALSRKAVGVKTLVRSTDQADFGFLTILEDMGAVVIRDEDCIAVKGKTLRGVTVDMIEMPDQVLTLAVLALFADSPTEIRNIDQLRYKETDRITNLITELRKLGADISYEGRVLTVKPLQNRPENRKLHTYNDHRLIMAFSLLTLIFEGLELDSHEGLDKSFPAFFEKLAEIIKA